MSEYVAFHNTHNLISNLYESLKPIYRPYAALDDKLDLEYCDDADCLKLVDPNSPPIKNILNNITNVKNKFVTKVIDPQIGQGRDFPASNCTIIRAYNSNAPNG